jgi:hypothetical protein
MTRTREELMRGLRDRKIPFDGRWNDEKLEALLPIVAPVYTEEQIANIADVLEASKPKPIESILNNAHRYDDGEVRTPNGLIIPDEVLLRYAKTTWVYSVQHAAELSVVTRKMYTGLEESVRTYSKADHGEFYKKLAEQFVLKNNQ